MCIERSKYNKITVYENHNVNMHHNVTYMHDVYGCQIYIWLMRHEQSTGDDLSIQSMKLQAVKYESLIMNYANIEYINDDKVN